MTYTEYLVDILATEDHCLTYLELAHKWLAISALSLYVSFGYAYGCALLVGSYT